MVMECDLDGVEKGRSRSLSIKIPHVSMVVSGQRPVGFF